MGHKRTAKQLEADADVSAKTSMLPPSYDTVAAQTREGHSRSMVADHPVADEHTGRLEIELQDGMDELIQTLYAELPPPEPTIPHLDQQSLSSTCPPKMNVLMLMVGSRGDVQPFICLAQELMQYGHRVRLATHTMFRKFVEDHGIEFFDLGGDPKQLMAYMVKNPGLIPGFTALRSGEVQARRETMRGIITRCWHACFQTEGKSNKRGPRRGQSSKGNLVPPKSQDAMPFVADAIIANPPSLGHVHCAERLGIPLHIFFT